MSRTCRNMEDLGTHGFSGLEHDSRIRLFKTYSKTSTLRGFEAPGKMIKQKPTNEERKTGKGAQNTLANGGIDRRDSHHFPQICEENVAREKGKQELCGKMETKTKAKTLGSTTAEESRNSRAKPQAVVKAYQNAPRTKPNSRGRNGHGVPPCEGWRRNRAENYQ